MKVLVSGVAGLFGIHTLEEMSKDPKVEKVYGIEDFSRGYPSENKMFAHEWGDKVEIKKQRFQDLTSKELDYLDVDAVIHLAGYNSGRESMNTAEEYFLNNEYGTFQLAQKLLRTKKKPHLVYASTVEAGGVLNAEGPSSGISRPQNTYAVTKLAAENHVYVQHLWNGYPVTILRFTNTFGENQNIYGFKSVISSFIDRALRHEPLIIYGTGEQKRDFLYVKDAVNAIKMTIHNIEKVNGKCIDICSGNAISINDLAVLIKKLTQSGSEMIHLPGEKIFLEEWHADNSIARENLKWEPDYTLEKGLLNTIHWHKCLKSI